jgi:hypothetical protein
MIGKVTKGNGVQKLLWYFWGPGRSNEHTDPHLVAAWGSPGEQDLATLEPASAAGRHDVRPLARLLEQPLAAQTRPPATAVWQCSLRVTPEDRELTDAEWDHAAREVLHRTGFAPRDDPDGCRWIAMRHGEGHIHLVVVLARQDGRPVNTRNDYYTLGEACRNLERQYDLRRTSPRDRTGPRRPTRAELEKTERIGKALTPRDELRREVRLAAVAPDDPHEFSDRLRERGVMVRPRRSHQDPDLITGYSVAWPGDHNADGKPVWFGGSKLSADLSWSRIHTHWLASTSPRTTTRPLDASTPLPYDPRHYARLARQLAHQSRTSSTDDLRKLQQATITVLMALTATTRPGNRDAQSLTTRIVLLDRALPSLPEDNGRQSADVTRLNRTARQIMKRRGKVSDLRELARAATWLIEAMTEGEAPPLPHSRDSHRTTAVPMGPSRSVPHRSKALRQ